jgi:hypothetical protein
MRSPISELYGCLEQITADGTEERTRRRTLFVLGEFRRRTHFGWWTALGPLQFVTEEAKTCHHRGLPTNKVLLVASQTAVIEAV